MGYGITIGVMDYEVIGYELGFRPIVIRVECMYINRGVHRFGVYVRFSVVR